MFDTSQLPPTSGTTVRWRHTSVTFVVVDASGVITSSHKLAEKVAMVTSLGPEDILLAVRPLQYPPRSEVLVVDDIASIKSVFADA